MGSLILQPFIEPPLFYLIRNIVGNGIQQPDSILVDVGIVDSNISAEGRLVFKGHCKKAAGISGGQIPVLAGIGIPKLTGPGDNQMLFPVKGLKQIGNIIQGHPLQGCFLGWNSGPAPFIGIAGISLYPVDFYDIGPLTVVKTSDDFQGPVDGLIQAVRGVQDTQRFQPTGLQVVLGCTVLALLHTVTHIHRDFHAGRPSLPLHQLILYNEVFV